MFIEWIFWGGFGLIIGSFVNVLIARHGTASILGRSACPSCKTTLQWFELVPVLSWILLRGRCRSCRARISLQYPIVELLTAAGFIALGLAPVSIEVRLIGALLIALLIAIAIYDLYHTIIPDIWSYTFGGLALFAGALSVVSIREFGMLFLAGPLVALPLFSMWLFSRGMWMGLGDAKLALGIGWLLGLLGGYVALSLAFFIGAFVGVFILLPLPSIMKTLGAAGITLMKSREGFTMKSEIPFGPFLICALCIVWFSQLYGLELVAHLARFLSWS